MEVCIEEMEGRYCRGTQAEIEDMLDFANMVFSIHYRPIDFAALLPKAYNANRHHLLTHHLIKEGTKIRALIDTYPVTMRLNTKNGRELKACYVGNVSVHPNTQGKGYMTALIKKAEEDARNQGCALMILDGNRHRYQHYGFERAGVKYRFRIQIRNIRHCCDKMYSKEYMEFPAYCFEEICEESPYIDYLYAQYQKRTMTARTREDFLLCLQSNYAVTYAVLRNNNIAGYVNLSKEEDAVLEFEIDQMTELPRVIYDLMEGLDLGELAFAVGADETEKIEHLNKIYDFLDIAQSHQIKILNYEKVLEFLLSWKQTYAVLAEADYIVGVQNADWTEMKKYLISVNKNEIVVSRTEHDPDVVFEELEFVRILTTAGFFAEQQKIDAGKVKNAPSNWFPLPCYLPDADAF